jgi:hypothetical protein
MAASKEDSMLLAPDSVVVASSRQLSCKLGGEAVVMGIDNGVYYGLNTVGAKIWQMLEKPRTVRQIVSAMVDEFEVDEARLTDDVVRFLHGLASQGLIDVRPG